MEQYEVIIGACGTRVWVNGPDGSNLGRFSKHFGMDVHTSVTEQMAGASQCLHCTHSKPSERDWLDFCDLMEKYYGIVIPPSSIRFSS